MKQIDEPLMFIASRKNVTKALFKALITFYGSIVSLFVSVTYFVLGNYLRGSIYSLAFVGMCLMCIQFSVQYKTFKFLAQFSGGIYDKKN